MGQYKKLWWTLIATLMVTLSILGYYGVEIYRNVPPMPAQFKVETSEQVLMSKEDILRGQSAWQSTGGMQIGSIWGHGAYQAPDWTADWLHRELLAWLELAAQDEYGQSYDQLEPTQQAILQTHLKAEYRTNTYDEATDTVTLSERRVQAIQNIAGYYQDLYGDEPSLRSSRESFAMKENTLPDPERRERLTDFFFWTAWAAATDRPGHDVTYTNNWPPEPLIDNVPSAENIVWSIISIIFLVAGIGFLVWGWAFLRNEEEDDTVPPKRDPITAMALTDSQKALWKYALLTVVLFIFQIFLGGALAHYTVEGQHFYGIELSKWFPYSLLRTWHLQSAVLWIASGFLTAGLFLTPIINGAKDPKYQRLGVNILFAALLIVTVGSFIGNYIAIAGHMPEHLNFMWGHQGYEYLDLGRVWQFLLFVGIAFWLVLMMRGLINGLRQKGDKHLLAIFTASVVAIGLFYGTGLFYGEHTPLPIMEYWRWWVVHLWVEGFFEVFATASLALVFVSLGLVSKRLATVATLIAATLFLVGGVPGTFHHLYFAGTTTPVMAVGAAFSALEVVPLILLGYEAWENWRLKDKSPWMERLRWPLMCFVAVAFWNMLGAGVFGFLINPPISLFYLQGLNTTPVHAHAALFGVYGFLSLGFVLMVLRYIRPNMVFSDKLMKIGFWGLNIGLVLMIAISLLPIGLYQFYASVTKGMWYARSEGFLQQDFLETLRWLRTIGDVVFIVGGLAILLQVVKGLLGKSDSTRPEQVDDEAFSCCGGCGGQAHDTAVRTTKVETL
ncbi:nitric-oxide reductase large subunit [Oligella urethralis]|uniref:nitric-oxide reductase large subunit n=1 Tax=Oligella urethralis TaxID=90245 RepID=UPI000E049895|nr:nitric-oxide reductase large subunit [Oligella urethralis]SUA58585.1 Nitric oxide reductase subunit B [Oligella urethralis]